MIDIVRDTWKGEGYEHENEECSIKQTGRVGL